MEFAAPDVDRFPCLRLAYDALRAGGTLAVVLNAANEVAVERFLARELPFTGIVEVVSRVLDRHAPAVAPIQSVDDALAWDGWARKEARGIAVAVQG